MPAFINKKFSLKSSRIVWLVAAFLYTVSLQAQTNVPASVSAVPGPTATVHPTPSVPAGTVVNYIRTYAPQQPFSTPASVTAATQVQQVQMTTQYVDALDRLMQTVNWQSSPGMKDLVQPVNYDPAGQQQYQYLPYTSPGNDGSFKTNPYGEQNTFYSSTYPAEQPAWQNEQFYYAHNIFEASTTNRRTKSFEPGNSWAGSEGSAQERSQQASQQLNTSTDLVQIWTVGFNALTYTSNDVTTNIPSTGSVYNPATLLKTVTTDERGYVHVDYKDFQGHLILHKEQSATSVPADYSGYTGFLCTYYVYDDIGNLRMEIPPKAVAQMIIAGSFTLSAGMINELTYRFEYDNRMRPIAQKSPGAGWVYTVYDQRDRPVFTQDANMRLNNQWMASLYDALDRVVMKGMMTYTSNPAALQTTVNGLSTPPSSVQAPPPTPPLSSFQADITLTTATTAATGTYEASNSVTLQAPYEADPNFVAEIAVGGTLGATGTDGNFTTVQGFQVSYDPIPSGATFNPLIETYYDNYTGTSKSYDNSNNSKLNAGTNPYSDPLPGTSTTMTRGLTTSVKTKVIENATDLTQGIWLETADFYDDKGRVIQAQSDNYKGGLDKVTTLYNFYKTILCAYEVHNYAAAGISNFRVQTNYNYDHAGRLLNITKNLNDDNNASSPSTTQRTIASYVYDALGNLKEKKLGQKSATSVALSTVPLEDESVSYNIRGWMKGLNWSYPGSGPSSSLVSAGSKWFGMDLSYDWGFGTNQFNGNIAGQRWVSGGDGQERSYGFGYDVSNKYLFGDFNQNFSGTWSKSDPSNANFKVDFTEKVGDGQTLALAYDENGNIRQLQHNGLVINNSPAIDNLSYSYENSDVSNKLQKVTDNATQPANIQLGDFTDKNTTGDDYGYDQNGNLISDLNRRFTGSTGVDLTAGGAIILNYMNLPYQITVKNDDGSAKGTITFIYDAAGNKLEKRVSELAAAYNNNTAKQTTDSYIQGFVYENNVLQYFVHEEGRVRPVAPTQYNNNSLFNYDFFVRDNLSNVRAVLTDQLQQDIYPAATLEATNPASIAATDPVYIEKQFYTIDPSYITAASSIMGLTVSPNIYQNNNGNPPVNNNPNCSNTSTPFNQGMNSSWVYRVNGQQNKTGLGITLRVMAGDKIDIFGNSYYISNAPAGGANNSSILVSDVLTNLLAGPSGAATIHGATVSGISSNTIGTVTPLTNFLNRPQSGVVPVAYINYVIFNDQFKYMGSGASPVGSNGTVKNHHNDLQNISIPQNGYLYVYVSNQSPVDVYFDNLQVVQSRSPLTETDNYYPTGLEMTGICSRAAGKLESRFLYTGMELQHQEFTDGTGMEEYDMTARYYDPQLGRWTSQDPASQFSSPYLGMGNSWPNGNDPNGKWFGWDDVIVSAVGFIFSYVAYGIDKHNWGGAALESGLIGAAIAEGGYLTLGGGLAAEGSAAGAGAGGLGSIDAATDFATNYGFDQASTFFFSGQTKDQIGKSSTWGAITLIAGYSAFAAIDAGFSSDQMEDAIDDKLAPFSGETAGVKWSTQGAWSDGIGGLINSAGDEFLNGYDPTRRTFTSTGGRILAKGLLEGFVGEYVGQGIESTTKLDKTFGSWGLNFLPKFVRPFAVSKLPAIAGGAFNFLNTKVWDDWAIEPWKN